MFFLPTCLLWTLFILFWTQPGNAQSGSPDFKFQHGVTVFGASEDSANASFTAVGSTSRTFGFLTNTLSGCAIDAAETSTRANRDMGVTGFLANASTFPLSRLSTGVNEDMRCAWTIGEYIGPASGANEILVREQGTIRITDGAASVDKAISRTENATKLMCLRTGATSNQSTAAWDRASVGITALRIGSDNVCRFQRVDPTGDTTTGYAALELPGPDWTLQNVTHRFLSSGVNEIEGLSPSVDWSHCHIFTSWSQNDPEADKLGAIVWPGADGSTIRFLRSNASFGPPTTVSASIACNPGLSVQHFNSITGSGVDIPSDGDTTKTALDLGITIIPTASLDQTLMLMTADNDSASSDYPRAFLNYRLTSTSDLEIYRAHAAGVGQWAIQIGDWSGLTSE